MTVLLDPDQEQRLREHGSTAYPEAAFGVLIGKADLSQGASPDEVVVHVVEVRPVEDRARDPRENHTIDPDVLTKIDDELESGPLKLVGTYHSHPDQGARPTDTDHEHARTGISHLILGVSEGYPDELTSWRLSDDRKTFHNEPIKYLTNNGDRPPAPE